MSQVLQNRTVNTFVKGLITEATELTFPPDASIDELNMSLDRDGSRRRRLGLALESQGDSFLTGFNEVSGRVYVRRWDNVADDSGLTFLVLQTNAILRFLDISASPIGPTLHSNTINLNDYSVGNGVTIADTAVEVASLNGRLYITHPAIDPLYLTYDDDTDSITATVITLRYRDFEFQGDRISYATTQETLSNQKKYDYYNIGWDQPRLNTYFTANGFYPALNLPWYAGKDASGNFSVTEFDKIYAGNTLAVAGHFILEYFRRDRTGVSGLPNGPTDENITERPHAVAAFAGRIWYAGVNSKNERGRVLFSQTIESVDQSGLCYQSADPTSEDVSDLIATDGGVINIPEAYNIKKLFPIGPMLIVFAENGIWSISGPDSVFSATEYYVSKLSTIGLDSVGSFVNVDGIPFWWSNTGIHTLTSDQVSGRMAESNISLSTIQKFFNNIGKEYRADVQATYDQTNKKIYWVYSDINSTNASEKDNVLVLDIVLQAFYPWRFGVGTSGQFVIQPFFYEGSGINTVLVDVEVEGDNVVVNIDQVQASQELPDYTNISDVRWLVWDGTGFNTARTTSISFLDWGITNYQSFVEAGFDFQGSMTLRKNAPVVTTMLGLTETGFTGDDFTGYNLVRPSSCLMSVYWDLRNTPSTTPKEVYRLTRSIVVDTDNLNSFNYPYRVIQTRQGVRGRGRSMRMKFESSEGKDFHLLGYEVITAINRVI